MDRLKISPLQLCLTLILLFMVVFVGGIITIYRIGRVNPIMVPITSVLPIGAYVSDDVQSVNVTVVPGGKLTLGVNGADVLTYDSTPIEMVNTLNLSKKITVGYFIQEKDQKRLTTFVLEYPLELLALGFVFLWWISPFGINIRYLII